MLAQPLSDKTCKRLVKRLFYAGSAGPHMLMHFRQRYCSQTHRFYKVYVNLQLYRATLDDKSISQSGGYCLPLALLLLMVMLCKLGLLRTSENVQNFPYGFTFYDCSGMLFRQWPFKTCFPETCMSFTDFHFTYTQKTTCSTKQIYLFQTQNIVARVGNYLQQKQIMLCTESRTCMQIVTLCYSNTPMSKIDISI